MDATCAIQNSIHVFSLVHINMCPGFWVHIILISSTGVIDSTGAWGCNHISHFDALVPKESNTGSKDFPRSERLYSTRGGISP